MCVFGRLMSQLADVNTQSAVGMCHFEVSDIALCVFCTRLLFNCYVNFFIVLLCELAIFLFSPHEFYMGYLYC